jgi:hypothetical protein
LLELSFRGLDCFAAADARGEADDPVRYLAAQPDLGIRPAAPQIPRATNP